MAQTVLNMAAIFENMRIPKNANPIPVTLPPPPVLTGALTPNNWLAKAQRYADKRVAGPESMVAVNGYLYTGLSNGWVVEIRPNGHVRGIRRLSLNTCGLRKTEDACGRPMGIRVDKWGYLVVADAYNGLFRMDSRNGRYLHLVNTRSLRVMGRPLGFINDLAVKKDGTIFFTSSSSKWTRSRYINIILEGEKSGRVLMYDPRVKRRSQVQELMSDLSFPNGVELSKDESYLLVAEGARARIYRLWLDPNSPKRGNLEIFAENLPGFVDNIRRSPRGTYWVGLSSVRHSGHPSVLDTYGNLTQLRRQIMGMPKEVVASRAAHYGLVVELNEDGKIIRSLHDPNGTLYTAVSEVAEDAGRLYIGSFNKNFVGVLSSKSLPPPVSPDPSHGTTAEAKANNKPNDKADTSNNTATKPARPTSTHGNTGSDTGTSAKTKAGSDSAELDKMLKEAREKMAPMSGNQLREMLLVLVKQIINTNREASTIQHRAARLKSDLDKLKEMLGQGKGTGATGTGGSGSGKTSGTSGAGGKAATDVGVRASIDTGTATDTGSSANTERGTKTGNDAANTGSAKDAGSGVTSSTATDNMANGSGGGGGTTKGSDSNGERVSPTAQHECVSGPNCGLV